jgi:hypothetical protein
VLKTLTWSVQSRRYYSILQGIYKELGLPISTDHWELARKDNEIASALAHHVGLYLLLQSSIEIGTSIEGKPSARRSRAAWKTVETGGGVRAAVYLTLGAAAILSREPAVEPGPVENATRLFERFYSPLDEDVLAIESIRQDVIESIRQDVIAQVARETTGEAPERESAILHAGEAALSFQALEIAGAEPHNMPAFEQVVGVDFTDWASIYLLDWKLAAMSFGMIWKDAIERFREIASTAYAQ